MSSTKNRSWLPVPEYFTGRGSSNHNVVHRGSRKKISSSSLPEDGLPGRIQGESHHRGRGRVLKSFQTALTIRISRRILGNMRKNLSYEAFVIGYLIKSSTPIPLGFRKRSTPSKTSTSIATTEHVTVKTRWHREELASRPSSNKALHSELAT